MVLRFFQHFFSLFIYLFYSDTLIIVLYTLYITLSLRFDYISKIFPKAEVATIIMIWPSKITVTAISSLNELSTSKLTLKLSVYS